MTEKQFKVTNISTNGMIGLFKLGNDTLSVYDVTRLVNELSEENEQLKLDNKRLLSDYTDVCNDNIALGNENEQLKQSIQESNKAILQDMGILMSDEDVVNIRNDIADKLLKPLFKSNGFDVDIDTTDGFTIIPKGDVE